MKRELSFLEVYIDKCRFVPLAFVSLPQICFSRSGKLLTQLLKNPTCFFKVWEAVIPLWTRHSETTRSDSVCSSLALQLMPVRFQPGERALIPGKDTPFHGLAPFSNRGQTDHIPSGPSRFLQKRRRDLGIL